MQGLGVAKPVPAPWGNVVKEPPKIGPMDEAGRRRAERVTTAKNVRIYPCTSEGIGQPRGAHMCDISPVGCGLINGSPMQPDTIFAIVIADPQGVKQLMLYRVMRCAACGDHLYRIGAKYLTTCRTAQEMHHVLSRAAKAEKV